MILADKIINERKKNGWSQEELAEQLSVSRQSISKWESAQAIPDIQKIIKMAELFGVTTDYLLKDEIEPEVVSAAPSAVSADPSTDNCIRVSMEEANEFLNMEEKVIPRLANMVSLCIFAPALLLFFIAVSIIPGFPVGTTIMTGIGVISMILLIAVAVFVFVIDGAKMKRFEYLEKSPIETLYGVSGMVKERKKASEQTLVTLTALGVIICILSVVPLLTAAFLEAPGYVTLLMVSLLLIFICAGVNLLVRAGSENGAYDKLLQEGGYSISEKQKAPLVGAVAPIYWILIVGIYLAWSFWADAWDRSWIIWPVAGVLFVIVMAVVSIVANNQKNS